MAFAVDRYAQVWEAESKGKYTLARISTSKKEKKDGEETGEYIQDFGAYVKLIGHAHNKKVKAGDRIKILNCAVENNYDAEKKRTFWQCLIFELEIVKEGNNRKDNNATEEEELTELENAELPF